MDKLIHITIRLAQADADRLSAEAKRLHLSASAVICRALAEMCERQEMAQAERMAQRFNRWQDILYPAERSAATETAV